MARNQLHGLMLLGAAALVAVTGVAAAAAQFPGGFDWVYMVISKLASPVDNPDGARWVAMSMIVASALLWPVAALLDPVPASQGVNGRTFIRMGLAGAMILGIEAFFAIDLRAVGTKAHELIAVLTFASLYIGVLLPHLGELRRRRSSPIPTLLVLAPLCAVAATQLHLLITQRGLGWVSTDWRELGIPFWLSFAFWQWTAVAVLGVGMGSLLMLGGRRRR